MNEVNPDEGLPRADTEGLFRSLSATIGGRQSLSIAILVSGVGALDHDSWKSESTIDLGKGWNFEHLTRFFIPKNHDHYKGT